MIGMVPTASARKGRISFKGRTPNQANAKNTMSDPTQDIVAIIRNFLVYSMAVIIYTIRFIMILEVKMKSASPGGQRLS